MEHINKTLSLIAARLEGARGLEDQLHRCYGCKHLEVIIGDPNVGWCECWKQYRSLLIARKCCFFKHK